MSSFLLHAAETLYQGRGRDGQISKLSHRRQAGVPIMLPTLIDLGAPDATDDDLLIDAAASTELPNAATKTYTPATDGTSPLDNTDTPTPVTIALPGGATALVWPLDVPRNLVAVATHATSVVAMTITVSGYDQYLRAMTETLSVAATGTSQTATGNKAFKYVSSIAITSAGNATTNTALNIGTGKKLGLPYKLASAGHVLQASIGGVQEHINIASNAAVVAGDATTASATTGDVRGTIAFNAALDGSKEVAVWAFIAGYNSAAGIAGVAQG